MKNISFKSMLLVSLLVIVFFGQNFAYVDKCDTDETCMRNCLCDNAYCDKKRHICVYNLYGMDSVDISSSKQHGIQDHKGFGNGAPPPRRLKL
ncbi:PREDICTED: putative defensin-like protein 256 [Camelina sativa]|uniref:Defensin-like protein 256 n=1 Tax=Camelina sativa TaxID=90675 RepID=A0ABM1QGX0_CAMSA|nr:PREDICTED: putative defensin-like protein 256 [Camelina sativa]